MRLAGIGPALAFMYCSSALLLRWGGNCLIKSRIEIYLGEIHKLNTMFLKSYFRTGRVPLRGVKPEARIP